jgi:hypothetical protein
MIYLLGFGYRSHVRATNASTTVTYRWSSALDSQVLSIRTSILCHHREVERGREVLARSGQQCVHQQQQQPERKAIRLMDRPRNTNPKHEPRLLLHVFERRWCNMETNERPDRCEAPHTGHAWNQSVHDPTKQRDHKARSAMCRPKRLFPHFHARQLHWHFVVLSLPAHSKKQIQQDCHQNTQPLDSMIPHIPRQDRCFWRQCHRHLARPTENDRSDLGCDSGSGVYGLGGDRRYFKLCWRAVGG